MNSCYINFSFLQDAKETGALQDAKKKLEKEVEELKTENTKLQSALEEMQLKLQAASKGGEQMSVTQEVSVVDHEIINKLTAENEQLKVKVLKLLQTYVSPE